VSTESGQLHSGKVEVCGVPGFAFPTSYKQRATSSQLLVFRVSNGISSNRV
jgi:hypothetical protein